MEEAGDVALTSSEVSRLEAAMPKAVGFRYDAHQIAMLESER